MERINILNHKVSHSTCIDEQLQIQTNYRQLLNTFASIITLGRPKITSPHLFSVAAAAVAVAANSGNV
jgi:hypothetical protein